MNASHASGSPWWERVTGRGVLSVARALGLDVTPPRGSSGGALPCPACSAVKRHTKSGDRRLAAGVTRDGSGWRCFQCDASGDALDLVAYRLRGERYRDLGDAGRDDVRAWCAHEWSDVAELLESRERGRPAPVLPPLPRVERVAEGAEPVYRTAEALELWRACVPISADAEVLHYLTAPRAEGGRGLRNARKLSGNVCRALPLDVRPSWTTHQPDKSEPPATPPATWAETGHRLVVPLFDAHGAMRSVLARAVRPSPRKSTAKGDRAGLIMANGLARVVLEHGALPEGAVPLRVVVAEGEIDFLTCVARGTGEAVLGMFAGSWSTEIAARIPDGAKLAVRTHNDKDGTKYAQTIVDSLAARHVAGRLSVRLAPWFASTVQGGRVVVKRGATT